MSLRPQNQCNRCAYTWFPRGKHRSLRCPGCGSKDIEIVEPPLRSSSGCGPVVLVAIVVVIAIIWAVSRPGSSSSASSSPTSESVGASAVDAASQAGQQAASGVDAASTSQDVMPASDTPPMPVSTSDASVPNGQSTDAIENTSGTAKTPFTKSTFATSFDCSNADHEDEVAICGDPGLAAMDTELAQLYQSALQSISDPKALAESESGWVTARHLCDGDLDCLRRAYGQRIGQFKGSPGSPPLLPTDSTAEKP